MKTIKLFGQNFTGITKFKKLILRNISMALHHSLVWLFYVVSFIYWRLIKILVKQWHKTESSPALHGFSIGEIKEGFYYDVPIGMRGASRIDRDLLRHCMLVKTIPTLICLNGKSLLDLGCNDGSWSLNLAQYGIKRVTGIDMEKGLIARANFLKTIYNYPGFKFIQRDIFDWLDNENTQHYDVIMLLSIIYHLPDQEKLLARFFNTIASINNECLVIDTKWPDSHPSESKDIIQTSWGPVKKWRPTRNEIADYLYTNGYEVVVECNPKVFLPELSVLCHSTSLDWWKTHFTTIGDYILGHRTMVFAYKKKTMLPDTALSFVKPIISPTLTGHKKM